MTAHTETPDLDPVPSSCQDADLADLVEMFVDEMAGRIEILEQAHRHGDRSALTTAAHQLKGAAGSYGFAPITALASRLEKALRGGLGEDEVGVALDRLLKQCRRVRYLPAAQRSACK